MICIDAEQLQDGLYNIKDGKIYKYKAKGGTVRAYKLENRPQGEWIKDESEGTIKCSNCGSREDAFIYGFEWDSFGKSHFCPSCGADMRKRGRVMVKAIPMEDWLRGCVYHDGRHGEVTLPTDKVLQIANYIQRTRRSVSDGLIDLKVEQTEPTCNKLATNLQQLAIDRATDGKE